MAAQPGGEGRGGGGGAWDQDVCSPAAEEWGLRCRATEPREGGTGLCAWAGASPGTSVRMGKCEVPRSAENHPRCT